MNWMTAGSGISHSERFDGPIRESGGRVHGIQAWVALPEAQEETEPSFIHHGADELPVFGEPGVSARLIAGRAFELTNPVRTQSPLFYIHAELEPGRRIGLPNEYPEQAAYEVTGRVEADGEEYGPGQLLVFAGDADPVLTALEASTVMLLGGEPLGPRHISWNFVSSRKERISRPRLTGREGKFICP